jgi:RNA polymerase sigma-70 factor (ECF subfamily)
MFFDEVYNKHYNELRRFGHQLNLPAEKCEDLAQETFMKFYLELKKNVIFENPRSWLYKVYLNLFRTKYKAEKHENPDNISGPVIANSRSSIDLHEELVINEKQKIVFDMMNRLQTKEREILLLYNKGLSYAEISEAMGINPNSVGTTLVRAIDKLKENIKIHYNELFEQS